MPRRAPRPLSPWSLVGAPLPERLAVAQDPASTSEHLVVVAPPAQDAKANPSLTELVVAVLRHPACPGPVAARFVGHPDPDVRRLVLDVDDLPGTAVDALRYDPEPDIRTRALDLSDGQALEGRR